MIQLSLLDLHILGSHGHRGSGSDYGDHVNGRRVSGSWQGDSGDDASETSSLCSERAVEVTNAIIYLNNYVIFYMYFFYRRMSLIFYVEWQVMNGLNEKKVLLVYII